MKLIDQHNRIADYLRIGVTDRCNLRCRYCMPEEGIDFAARKEILSYEEIARLARIFKKLGVQKVRLTGGEPFVRKDIDILLRELCKLFPKVHITTNATLLQNQIPLLKELKIKGLNISIDSLDRDKFFLVTRRDAYEVVMSNILNCLKEGIPTKLNVVVMKGINDMEILDFVEFGLQHNMEVRFIEAMPFNEHDGNKNVFLPAKTIHQIIAKKYASIVKESSSTPSSSDKYIIDGHHRVGIIPAYSRTLCSFCNRIRLTPQGELMTCLYSSKGLDLRSLVRNPEMTEENVREAIINAVSDKKKDGVEEEKLQEGDVFRSMTTIGG